jgi:hypothetical protein
MILDDKNIHVTMSNVHYCSEIDSNMILLEMLEANKSQFRDRNDWASVIDNDEDVFLQAKRQNNVYSLI